MVMTASTMLALGTKAPDFRLPDVISGSQISLSDFPSGKPLLVMFICEHCPYVKHVQKGLVELANDYMPTGVAFIAVNSNDVGKYPEDSPANMKRVALSLGYPFPYLFDETQEVARVYAAACTPDFYVFDAALKLAYRGQMDDSRPGNGKPVTGKNIREALDRILNGDPVGEDQVPSIGCNIKWK